MKPIKIAIVGFGKIAADQHVPSIEANPRFDLVAASSRSGQGVARVFTDWRELIRSVDGLEAVAITTPPGPRYEIARECILAGLHCLLEKPPTAGLAPRSTTCLPCRSARRHPLHHLACAASLDRRRRGSGARRQTHPLDGDLWHEDVHKWHPGQSWIWEPGGLRRVRPGDQRLLDRHEDLPRRVVRRIGGAEGARECADADRRRRHLLQPRGRRAAHRQPRLAPDRGRGVDDRRRNRGGNHGPARGRRLEADDQRGSPERRRPWRIPRHLPSVRRPHRREAQSRRRRAVAAGRGLPARGPHPEVAEEVHM